jgi:hypothetical protein
MCWRASIAEEQNGLRVCRGYGYRSDRFERERRNDLFRAVLAGNRSATVQVITTRTDRQAGETDAGYRIGDSKSLRIESVKRIKAYCSTRNRLCCRPVKPPGSSRCSRRRPVPGPARAILPVLMSISSRSSMDPAGTTAWPHRAWNGHNATSFIRSVSITAMALSGTPAEGAPALPANLTVPPFWLTERGTQSVLPLIAGCE